jgi:hypothetical protein
MVIGPRVAPDLDPKIRMTRRLVAAPIPPHGTAELAVMRMLALAAAAALLLSACAGVLDDCPHGLDPPPPGSSIPAPHG